MVSQGDRVLVDGKEAIVETSWGQGKHRAFQLNDGRVILDLTDVSLVKEDNKMTEKSERKWDWLPTDGQHDLEE